LLRFLCQTLGFLVNPVEIYCASLWNFDTSRASINIISCQFSLSSSLHPRADSLSQSYLLPLLDYLLAATKGLVAHAYVERFFPYALVRQNFVALANAQIGASTLKSFGTRTDFDAGDQKE
jgi:hypothetical protein